MEKTNKANIQNERNNKINKTKTQWNLAPGKKESIARSKSGLIHDQPSVLTCNY